MRSMPAAYLIILIALDHLSERSAAAQSPDTGWQTRPKLTVNIDLLPRTRISTWGELQHGVNFSYQRWRTGAILSRRLKPIMKSHRTEIDEENEHYLVLGGGYEYLHTVQNRSKRIENRTIAEVTSRVHVGRVRLRERNRAEFRWVNGV